MKTFASTNVLAFVLVSALSGLHAEDHSLKDPKVAVQFSFDGAVTEQSNNDDPIQVLLNSNMHSVGLRDWSTKLETAAKSDRVTGVFLVLDDPGLSWTHALALRDAIAKIRKAGKPVIAYAECLSTPQFLLAAAADKIYLSPGGEITINGINARQYFLKGTLDKLGIQADLHHIGTHKSAAEPLTLTVPSKQSEEMMNWLLDDFYKQLCEEIGAARGKDAAAGKAWLDGGPYTASQALAAGLVDGLKSRADTTAEFKTLNGLKEDAKLERKFGEKKAQTVDFSNPFAVFKVFADLSNAAKPNADEKPAVGIIYLEGQIESGKSQTGASIGSLSAIADIEKARKNDSIKAVVLRINSPGGSALASEEIHAALLKLKAAKPVVVSVASMAASGGYYIAAPAERIFTAPNSLVGSIGVVGGKIVFKGLYDLLGVTSFSYTRGGPNSTMLDETTAFTPEQQKWFMTSMTEVYEQFVKAVKDGRGDKLKDFENKITGGKVFTGRQSVDNGLADELGGLDQALAFAAKRGGLKEDNFEVRVINKPEGFAQKFLKGLSGNDDDDVADRTPTPKLSLPPEFNTWLQALSRFDKGGAAAITHQLRALALFQREQVLMLAPFEISVKP